MLEYMGPDVLSRSHAPVDDSPPSQSLGPGGGSACAGGAWPWSQEGGGGGGASLSLAQADFFLFLSKDIFALVLFECCVVSRRRSIIW